MPRFKETVSSLAIIATLTATPMAAYAASEETSAEGEVAAEGEANMETDNSGESTEAEADANMEATEATEDDEATAEGDANMESSGEAEAVEGADANMETEAAAEGEAAADSDTTAEAEPAGDVEGTIMMQGENTVLAGDLIGSTVYNMSDESIGDINDMIVSLDGKVEGVVIGVGGFLGLGEKNVAIELSEIELKSDEGATPKLFLDTTAEELEAAEELVTAREQWQLEQLKQSQEDAQENVGTVVEKTTAD